MKERIIEAARSLGFQRTVIASVAPMEKEREEYERWLSLGYAAGMEYLKRNPYFRTSPHLLVPGSRSAIVVSVSYYSEPPEAPGHFYGKVARYAVGQDYHAVLRARLRQLRELIEEIAGRPLFGRAFTDDVALFEQGLAARHGLGFAGRHTLIIGPKLTGTFNFVGELLTDLELEPDEPYQGTCGKCFRCGEGCPTDAIKYGDGVDSNLCISYLTIENKGGIPIELRKLMGRWVFGCDVCQNVCPYNQKPPPTPWSEFHPSKGAGHYLDLLSMLSVATEDEYRARFAHTPLRRPKRRGMLRNVLTVLGNCLSDVADGAAPDSSSRGDGIEQVTEKILDFAEREEDPMLREHALWAASRTSVLSRRFGYLIEREEDPEVRALVGSYI